MEAVELLWVPFVETWTMTTKCDMQVQKMILQKTPVDWGAILSGIDAKTIVPGHVNDRVL